MSRLHSLLLATLCCLGLPLAAEDRWIEAEQPDHQSHDAGQHGAAWGHRSIISGEVFLVNIDGKDTAEALGEDGLIIGYDFTTSGSEPYQLWGRIGWEWARSPFDWRVDGGEWQTVTPDLATVDLMQIQTWNELGWLRFGELELAAGDHRLEIRHRQYTVTDNQDREKPGRILHGTDCYMITDREWHPTGPWRPDQDHRDDDDRAAAEQVYALPASPLADGHVATRLDGLWEYALWDEREFPITEATRLEPTTELPSGSRAEQLRWFAIDAPGSREAQFPGHVYGHRYLLRTRVDVPADLADRGFVLDVQRSSMIVSVFVNGEYAGHSGFAFHTAWQLDLTPHVRPGAVNELTLVVKDAYYSLNPEGDAEAEGLGNRRYWNRPPDFLNDNQGTTMRHDWPVARDIRSGLLEPASIVVTGAVYTADVFAQPSVRDGELGLEITVHNPGEEARAIELRNRVEPWNEGAGGAAECTFASASVNLPAGAAATVELTQAWPEPTLWWPDRPHLYRVVTEIVVDGEVVDVRHTRFGFREWTWDEDHHFRLNGVKWQMWADTNYTGSPQEFMALTEESHMNQIRYWRDGGWAGMTRREVLDYFDEQGMPVRSSGTFDGQRANYGGGLREENSDGERVAKARLWQAWREQMTAWVKEERNHPCIYIWSVENEIAYINVHNLGQWRECEPELTRGVEHVMAVDPTRPAMVDGGNCLRDESLPVNGAHYTERYNVDFRDFPDAAYTRAHWYDEDRLQRGAWRMVPDRPIMKGEVFFANGYGTDLFATIGGDRCFIGTGETMAARGLWARMLSEGWRWAEVSSWHFWLTNADRDYYQAWSPVAVFCRQWNWSWGAGDEVERLLKVFNSTRHADPITARWSLVLGGEEIAAGEREFSIAPGEAEEWPVAFTLPASDQPLSGSFTVTATRGDEEVYRREEAVRVLAPQARPLPEFGADELAVFDPQGTVQSYLTARGVRFTAVAAAEQVPDAARVVVVGPDAVSERADTDQAWLGLAARGKRVIVLDQRHPLRFQAIPADVRPTSHTGRIAFSQDLSHPIFDGLTQADLFTWGNDHVVYRHSYAKGTRGGRSLAHCDNRLGDSALLESQVEDGLLILCQLAVGSKLADHAVPQQLFGNLLDYADEYQLLRRQSYVVLPAEDPRLQLLADIDLSYERLDDPLAALEDGNIAIVDASPENLAALAAAQERVAEFCRNGGWLMLWGLTPEGLEDYNALVDHEHVIRRFDRERVVLNMPLDPLASGMTLGDVVMDTGQKMYHWMSLKEPDRDAFTYVVDHDDIAPFATFPSPTELGKPSDDDPGADHWPRNLVNGFTSDDNWSFCYTIIMDRGDSRRIRLELPREEEIVSLRIRPSKIYHPISEMKIYFDDDPEPVIAEIPVREQPITEDIPIDGRRARVVTLEVSDWGERGSKNIVVIDNIALQVRRSEEYRQRTSSLLNVGALMVYRRGEGGIVLNQLNIRESEPNPDNVDKKKAIASTLIGNLGGILGGGRTVVAGSNVVYHPVAIPDARFNAYPHREREPRWFRGPTDLNGMPTGAQRLANVDYQISDFSTSPVPAVFMLAGHQSEVEEEAIEGIEIDRRADALFFLHTYQESNRIDRWQRDVERARERNRDVPPVPVVFGYRVHYADGSAIEVPVRWEQGVASWLQREPSELMEASLAWSGEAAGNDGQRPVLYGMQWTNPRPDVVIHAVDLVHLGDSGEYGTPALVAITAATVAE